MPSSPQQANSLLHLLNPYASMSRSANPSGHADPDSPSAYLLRELQGDNSSSAEPQDAGSDDEDEDDARGRRHLSPTPTPTTSHSRPPTHVIATPSTSTSSDDEGEAPPRSLIFGDRTPTSPPDALPSVPFTGGRRSSPGPFHAPGSSTSESRSTSPGPSTIAHYASGLASNASRDPSTSPDIPISALPPFEPVTEPPPRPEPSRQPSKKASPRLKTGQGYLDPNISSPSPQRKAKAKRTKSGRQYAAVPTQADEEDEVDALPDRGRLAGFLGMGGAGRSQAVRKAGLNEYEKALWRWVNVEDLDGFLQEVYDYYKGKGLYCIALARVLNLLTTFFVIGFTTFLTSCIDYPRLRSSTDNPSAVGRLDDVLVDKCLTSGSFPHMLLITAVGIFYAFQLFSFALSLPRLLEMYRFYTHLLGVPDADIQTLPWPEIVRLIGEIRKHNPITSLSNGQAAALADMVGTDSNKAGTKKLDAHDVANRILRQENYLIALFNKDLLDLRFRLPLPHSIAPYIPKHLIAPPTAEAGAALPTAGDEPDRKFLTFGGNNLTKALEWNLRFCLMGYLFDRRGQVRKEFVKERRRKDLVEGLRRRFIFMGVLNAMFAPFIVVYLLVYSFFRYFEEYHKNPSSIGSRQYTPYAQWKFREFNELPHLFERRLDRSYPTAKEYIDQFPKERTALVMRFVAFVAGSFAAVLLVASLLDPDLFLHFEVTPHRTVLFYLGIFGSVLAIARGMVPEENLVFDPEASLREVVRWTHYLPGEWRGRLHSQMVHAEFSNLFQLKITVFFQELLSVLLTPFILLFSLPPCAAAIIDFFREFTVHVEGVGYVCSFAVFDFRRQAGHTAASPTAGLQVPAAAAAARDAKSPRSTDHRFPQSNVGAAGRANENKMEKSFLHFKATHPDWQPSLSSSVFLDRLMGMHMNKSNLLNPHSPQIAGSQSVYAGGRGLGLDEPRSAGMRERSRSNEQTWARGSMYLPRPPSRSTTKVNGTGPALGAGPGAGVGADGKLATMAEDEGEVNLDESLDGEAEQMGWNRRLRPDDDDVEGDEGDEDERGFMRDAGMIGLLQQVLNR